MKWTAPFDTLFLPGEEQLFHSAQVFHPLLRSPLTRVARLLCDVWGELEGPQSSRADSRHPWDASSLVRSTDEKPAGSAWFPFTHSSSLSGEPSARHSPSQADASFLVLMPSLFPGFAQPRGTQFWRKIKVVTARTKPKQKHARDSDVNLVPRETSCPTQRGRKEYPPLFSERLYT